MSTTTYDHAPKIELNGGDAQKLERMRTAGGHVAESGQPSLPVVHRKFANPAPLGLLSFATDIFLISILGVHARGIQSPNILVGVLMFFGGICQFISGIMVRMQPSAPYSACTLSLIMACSSRNLLPETLSAPPCSLRMPHSTSAMQ